MQVTTPFSLSTDGSNDKGSEQVYPIVVRYFDKNNSKVCTDVLSIPTPDGNSTGENIFNALETELQTHGLSWDNCLSFGADNASVMLGNNKGVATKIQEKNPAILIQGCPCHLLHLAAKKATDAIWHSSKHPRVSKRRINEDLDHLGRYCNEWELKINYTKTVYYMFTVSPKLQSRSKTSESKGTNWRRRKFPCGKACIFSVHVFFANFTFFSSNTKYS